MSLESDLNRACRRGARAARIGGHDLSMYHTSDVERVAFTSRCLNKGCGAVVAVTSTMKVVGDAVWTICQGDDPCANQFESPDPNLTQLANSRNTPL